jgi:hypothetical protein
MRSRFAHLELESDFIDWDERMPYFSSSFVHLRGVRDRYD